MGRKMIYLDDAIDALEEQLDYLQMLNKDENPTAESKWHGVNWARNTIADLPSAQPEKSTTAEKSQLAEEKSTCDLIRRQDATKNVRNLQTYKLFEDDDMLLVDVAEVLTELMMLPSAQPEPYRGDK